MIWRERRRGAGPAAAAESRAAAESLWARGEHRAMLPSVDFAAQYALLAAYNNYQDFFQPGSFQRHNATIRCASNLPSSVHAARPRGQPMPSP